eukprot:COSAG05_NODE_143_length_16570_cov_12.041953_8_plen_78_part_00
MENEKVLRLRIGAEKCGPKSKFGPGNSVDNRLRRLSFPTHPRMAGRISMGEWLVEWLVELAGANGWNLAAVERWQGC